MLEEVISWLQLQPGDVVVDGTLGGGGHTKRLTEAVGETGRVVAVDRDAAAVARAEQNLKGLPIFLAHASYTDVPEVLEEVGLGLVNGIFPTSRCNCHDKLWKVVMAIIEKSV